MDRAFWTWLLRDVLNDQTSDVDFYVNGRASAAEVNNAIKMGYSASQPGSPDRRRVIDTLAAAGAFKPTDDLTYWYGDNLEEVAPADLENLGKAAEKTVARTGDAPAQGVAGDNIWDWAVNAGLMPDTDPLYYSEGRAQPGEYGHALTVALQATPPGSAERRELVDRMYKEGIITSADTPEGRAYWTDTAGDAFGADIDNLAKAAETKFTGPQAAGPADPTGVMKGGTLTKITRKDSEPLWGMVYLVDGIEHVYTFASESAMKASLGEDAGLGAVATMTEDEVNDGDTWIIGDAASLGADATTTYATWWDAIKKEAALEAGIRQPGLAGEYISNPEVQRIIAMGAEGDWSDARIKAELRATDYYQTELYPGIAGIMAHNATNPEGEWMAYMNSVAPYLGQLGYDLGGDGSYRHLMGEMLDKQIRADEFQTFAATFIRAEQSPEYMATLNQWYQADTGTNLEFDQWFDVLAGTSDPELDAIVEKAGIQFQAEQTNLDIGSDQIARLAGLTEFSEQQIAYAFSGAESKLLGLGDDGLSRYGLSEVELVNAAFGVETSGKSAADINRLAAKTLAEIGAQDDKKAQFYSTFDQRKRPVKEGLAASAPEFG